jgi:hypothetical protein
MTLFAATALTLASVAVLVSSVIYHNGNAAVVGVGLLVLGRALLIAGRQRERRAAERVHGSGSAGARDPLDPESGGVQG